MESKSLLFGIVGFIAGGLIVAIAASTSQPPEHSHTNDQDHDHAASMSIDSLKEKSGDAFDKEFISQMIAHHQGALDMAELSADRAKHTEIKQLSTSIISSQSKEIDSLRSWQKQWGYDSTPASHSSH